MLALALALLAPAVHAAEPPCEKPLLEKLVAIERLARAGEWREAVRVRQRESMDKFLAKLPEFEGQVLNTAEQGYLPVYFKPDVWVYHPVGTLRYGDGPLVGSEERFLTTDRRIAFESKGEFELTPAGAALVDHVRALGIRIHLIAWRPGAGRFRAVRDGRWEVMGAGGDAEPVTVDHPRKAGTPLVPAHPPGVPILLLEWTESPMVRVGTARY